MKDPFENLTPESIRELNLVYITRHWLLEHPEHDHYSDKIADGRALLQIELHSPERIDLVIRDLATDRRVYVETVTEKALDFRMPWPQLERFLEDLAFMALREHPQGQVFESQHKRGEAHFEIHRTEFTISLFHVAHSFGRPVHVKDFHCLDLMRPYGIPA